MRCIAIYDLDRTVLRRATFTPFLSFAARKAAPWRMALMPVWIGAMAAYKLGLIERGRLKAFGLRLFLGSSCTATQLDRLGRNFADRILPQWLAPGAALAIERDRADGCRLVLATAAMDFYAAPLAEHLRFDAVLATRTGPLTDAGRVRLDGRNCYDADKVVRMQQWLDHGQIARKDCSIRFYSDSLSDAPLLEWADEAILVNAGPADSRHARDRGWRVERFQAGRR